MSPHHAADYRAIRAVVDFLRGTPPYVAGPELASSPSAFGSAIVCIRNTMKPSAAASMPLAAGDCSTSLCCAATRVAPRVVGTCHPRLAFLAHRKLPMEEIYETYFDRDDACFGY